MDPSPIIGMQPQKLSAASLSMQKSLLRVWTECKIEQQYQAIFMCSLENLSPRDSEKLMAKEIRSMEQHQSLYHVFKNTMKAREPILAELHQFVTEHETQNSPEKSKLEESTTLPEEKLDKACKLLEELRRVNLEVAESIIKLAESFSRLQQSRANHKIYVLLAEFFAPALRKLEGDNKMIKNSLLRRYICFQEGYDPFFLHHYEKMIKSSHSSLTRWAPVNKLFALSVSSLYRMLKAQSKILEILSFQEDTLDSDSNFHQKGKFEDLNFNTHWDDAVKHERISPEVEASIPNKKQRKQRLVNSRNQTIQPEPEPEPEAERGERRQKRVSKKSSPKHQSSKKKELLNQSDMRIPSLEVIQQHEQKRFHSLPHKVSPRYSSEGHLARRNAQKAGYFEDAVHFPPIIPKIPRKESRKNPFVDQRAKISLMTDVDPYTIKSTKPTRKIMQNYRDPNFDLDLGPSQMSAYDSTGEEKLRNRRKLLKIDSGNDESNSSSQINSKGQEKEADNEIMGKTSHPKKNNIPLLPEEREPQYSKESQRERELKLELKLEQEKEEIKQREFQRQKERMAWKKEIQLKEWEREKQRKSWQMLSAKEKQEQALKSTLPFRTQTSNQFMKTHALHPHAQQSSFPPETFPHPPIKQGFNQSKVQPLTSEGTEQDLPSSQFTASRRPQNMLSSSPEKHFARQERNMPQFQSSIHEPKLKQQEQGSGQKTGQIRRVQKRLGGGQKQGGLIPTFQSDIHKPKSRQQEQGPGQKAGQIRRVQKRLGGGQQQNGLKRDQLEEQNLKSKEKIEEKKKIVLKAAGIDVRKVQEYITAKEIVPMIESMMKHSQGFPGILSNHSYLHEFYVDNVLEAIGICSALPENLIIRFWGGRNREIDQSSVLFGKYLDYLEKASSCEKIYLFASNLTSAEQAFLGNHQFLLSKGETYIRPSSQPPKPKPQQHFSIKCSNIIFEQKDETDLFYSEEIEQFSQINYICSPELITPESSSTLPEQKMHLGISSMSEINKLLEEDGLDDYHIEPNLSIKNISLCILHIPSVYFMTAFIVGDGFMKLKADLVTEVAKQTTNSTKPTITRVKSVNKNYFFLFGKGYSSAKAFSAEARLRLAETKKPKPIEISVRMFNKQLYGRLRQFKGGCYGNWEIILSWKDQLQGRIIHQMTNVERYGPESFFVGIFGNQKLLVSFQVSQTDFL